VEKGVEILINIVKELKKSASKQKICIAGEGDMRKYIQDSIKIFRLRSVLDYVGFKNHGEALRLIAASKYFLLPSENEGLPMVVLEAAGLGVASIVKPFSGHGEIITNGGNGYIFKDSEYIRETIKIFSSTDYAMIGKRAKDGVMLNHSFKNKELFLNLVLGTHV
jgi:glycosyltransferase involved in cell wall biosynthesis